MKRRERRTLDFSGLRAAPSQVVGAVRLVPLLRDEPIEALRLYAVPTGADLTVARLDRRTTYTAYVPHALMIELPDRAPPRACLGSRLLSPGARPDEVFRVQVVHRLARREEPWRMRLLPQHLGMDAYLTVGFAGPDVAWPEYSREALSRGLSPRSEWVSRATRLPGFADALRVFEMHPGQVGVLVFVSDALSTAFITPRPEDYRQLHRSLLQDMVAELLVQYAVLYPQTAALWEPVEAASIGSLEDLGAAVQRMRSEWDRFAALMASGLMHTELDVQFLQRLGGFRLMRFCPTFKRQVDNHVGEAIVDSTGRLAYLKTMRLSAQQSRRGLLLATLTSVDWNLDDAARALQTTRDELIARLRKHGLERLLKAWV